MEGEGREGSEKKQVVVAAKKMARSGSKNNSGAARSRAPAPVRGARGHGRRWSSSTDLDFIETVPPPVTLTPTAGGGAAAAAVLGRSYSTTAAVAAAAVDGGVKQEQKQQPEGEAKKRCGAGARLSRKIKEHRARFYIVRRCIAMLVCWRDDD